MRTLYAEKKVIFKIVYYGPALSGKTTNLEKIFELLKPEQRLSKVIKHTETEGDRTLFFDFLPVSMPPFKNFKVQLSLFTVPGQAHYYQTRKRVLEGADGVVFVADSQKIMRDVNCDAMEEMREYLTDHSIDPDTVPMVVQANKRDLSDLIEPITIKSDLGRKNANYFIASSAITGKNVFETLQGITKQVIAANEKQSSSL